uniref:Methyltransferase type 11 domain-containing protein n=1 Tax=Kalanchoe fedtschenkoi TaxID=63787 RepID=A0A7N1A7B9_KALFE
MATSVTLLPPSSAALRSQCQSLPPFRPSVVHHPQFRPFSRPPIIRLSSRIQATSAPTLQPEIEVQRNNTLETDPFACPVCYAPLIRKGPPGLNLPAIYRSGFKCKRCNKTYSSKENYLDLTVTSGAKEYTETKPTRTELFRSPLVSFLYERGWRQNFAQSGFPGPDEEFRMAQEYFKPAKGGLLVDVSCGSGLFSRKFAQSGTYAGVIALDFSENMLRQCYDFIKEEDALLNSNLALVRADVSRLPFQTGTVDAVHAGAALHCWPSPSNAIAEISRVLRSGGVFVGTTFLRYSPSTPSILRPLRERVSQSYNNLAEEEIKDLCLSCGLTNYSSEIQRIFIMFSAQKP